MPYLRLFLFCLPLSLATTAFAQKEKPDNSEKSIKNTINRFFEAMEKGDTALLRSVCSNGIMLQTYMADEGGALQVFDEDFAEFVSFVGAKNRQVYKEVIEFEAIHSEKSLAVVWTPYKFYINDKLSHCGTNSFQLIKTTEGWKIHYIIDTRRKACK